MFLLIGQIRTISDFRSFILKRYILILIWITIIFTQVVPQYFHLFIYTNNFVD